jgi:ATP-dependent Lon protease
MNDDVKVEHRDWRGGPLPLQVMMMPQWHFAFDFLFLQSAKAFEHDHDSQRLLARTKASDDREVTRAAILDVIEAAFAAKKVEVALAWSFLAADPARPETIQTFLPQVAALLAKASEQDEVYTDAEIDMLRETMDIWIDAAGGLYVHSRLSVFAIAARARPAVSDAFKDLRSKFVRQLEEGDDGEAGLVVMPKATSTKLVAETSHWKDVIGKRLPFAMVSDLHQLQATLRSEYPHAWNAIGLLTRDLRDGKPARLKPAILLGEPGSGKSRMVRRLAELLGTSLYRFDASSVSDALSWSGTARGWGNTTPSIPARAVQQAMRPNPLVLIDEIEKSGIGWRAGSLFTAMTPFLERETSQRLRDISLDAVMDLSWVSYVATANDDSTIPPHIRDRFRVIKVPLPTVEHLRPLAANIMADMAAEADVDPRWMAPLDADEEAVIARAWTTAGMSIRNLQKIVGATLEARDAFAMRN